MRSPQVRFAIVLLLLVLVEGSCTTVMVLSNSATATFQRTATGCSITVSQPAYSTAPKDLLAHAWLLSATADQLTFQSKDDDYSISFPGGSPVSSTSVMVPAKGSQNLPIKFTAKVCSTFHSECTYTFQVTDMQTGSVCDPVVHITK
jgi:hypothetical protein